jgi:tyrosyl-tRNA synthetase
MAQFKSDFMRVLHERGFVHQCTDSDALDRKAAAGELIAYVGYDCTADSLHIGHLVTIMVLRWLQKTGNKPIALMGGGTTKVGDPSGRDETRKLLTSEQIDANMLAIRRSFANFISFDGGNKPAIMANNAEWLDGLMYIPLLRDVGRHFSVNRMLTMDSVRLRLERDQPLSFLEFNYMVMGAELGRRMEERELYGLTVPLITTASGAKMGKTAAGAVWLNPERLSTYDYWQFWRNTEDADVGRFMRLFTDLPMGEIARLEKLAGAEINDAKKILAFEATRLCHGEAAATQAGETARKTFEEGALADDLPTIDVAKSVLAKGVPAYELLRQAGLATSNAEARRLIKGGGGRLNDQPIAEETMVITLNHADGEGRIKLSAGRKKHVLVRTV